MKLFKKWFVLGLFFALASCASQETASSQDKQAFILKFKSGVSQADQSRVLQELHLKVDKKLELVDAYVCVYEGDMDSEKLIDQAGNIPEVDYLEVDQTVHTQ